MDSDLLYTLLDFDVDRYLNPCIPHNRLYILPKPISRWLGYREKPQKEPYAVLQWPVTFLAIVASLCLVSGIGTFAPGIAKWHPPVIASLGASAVLYFNTIKSPLAQPRNAVLGNTLAAICGVAIAKLFQLSPDFMKIQWVSGAVGCALASWVMSLTNTIHPPGGATAVLASTEMQIIALGWRFVPLMLLDSVLMAVVALIFNNILRQYPIYWWTPANVGRKLRQERREEREQQKVEEKAAEEGKAGAVKKAASDTSSDRTLRRELSNRVDFVDDIEDVHIRSNRIEIPHHLKLSDDEMILLEHIQERLRTHGEIDNLYIEDSSQ